MAIATAPPVELPAKLRRPLKVFISYKKKDVDAAKRIRAQLAKIGSDHLNVFVAGDEKVMPGAEQWREVILTKLRDAHVLIFLYSDPSLQWDWCLYETGYFDGRMDPRELNRRLYLLHRHDVTPAGPFRGLTTIPVCSPTDLGESRLKSMLKALFMDTTDVPVNEYWDADGCDDLIRAFTEPFRGAMQPPREFVHRLTYRLTKGPATEALLASGRVPGDARVSGAARSFRLFNLDTDADRPWSLLESQWREKVPLPPKDKLGADPVVLWTGDLASKMLAAIRGEYFDDGLPLFKCPFVGAHEKGLFRPALTHVTEHAEAYEFDVVFVEMPAELTQLSTGPLSTVGGMLRLAHMFRLGWIEPMFERIVQSSAEDIPGIVQEMTRRMNSITAESFSQRLRTETAVLEAFDDDSPLRAEVQEAMARWSAEVAPALEQAGTDQNVDGLRAGLREASKINWQFHRACARRYAELVEEYAARKTSPGQRV